MSKRKHPSKEKLEELYLSQKLSGAEIAKKYNMSKVCVCRALRKFGIPIRECVGENHPSWKGGRVVHTGYIDVYNPNHPRANHIGYVKEHILIMEKVMGRPLKKEEQIHHIDFDRKNNTVNNLWLSSNSSHHIAQNSIFKLIKTLLEKEIIKFDVKKGEYILC